MPISTTSARHISVPVRLLCASAVLAGTMACSKSNPTAPGGGVPAALSTFVGTLEVPGGAGLGGLLVLNKSSSVVASRSAPGRWLSALSDLLQPALLAQSSASGTLVTDAGPVVPLTGTFNNSTFRMSGGGYSIMATVNGAAISGSGTAPGSVSAQVMSMPTPVASTNPPNPSGTYTSPFQITPTKTFKLVRNDNGVVMANCQEPRSVDGNLSIRLSTDDGNTWDGHLGASWTERPNGTPTGFGCAAVGGTNSDFYGIDFRGPLDTLVFARVHTQAQNGLTDVTTLGFVGVINNSTIQGRFWISYITSGITAAAQTLTIGYPATAVNLTLTK